MVIIAYCFADFRKFCYNLSMKSILVVSDFFVGGGLETRILEQIKVYQEDGVRCYLAVDEYNEGLAEKFDGVLRLPLRASDRRTIIQNVDALVGFCRENEVDMIDAQPLYSVIAASFASAILHVPMSFTLHAPCNMPWLADDPLLTWFHLALELRKPQIVLVAEYLNEVYPEFLAGKDVKVVRNGVILPEKKVQEARGRKWVFASRLSGPKHELPLGAIPVLEKAGVEQLDIFGRGDDEKQVSDFAEAYNADKTHKMRVNFCGWCESVVDEILQGDYEGGIGMDRVAVEMMSTGLPVVILGYGGLTEGVSEDNFEKLIQDNWSSREKFAEAEMIKNIEKVRENPKKYDMREMVAEQLDSEKIWTERLEEVGELKTDLGRDAMIMAVWQDYYENEARAREIEGLRAQLDKTFTQRLKKTLRKA